MADCFSNYADSAGARARNVVVIPPRDAADLPDTPRGIYSGSGGDMTLVQAAASAGSAGVAFRNLPVGALLPVRTRRVAATATTAAEWLTLI